MRNCLTFALGLLLTALLSSQSLFATPCPEMVDQQNLCNNACTFGFDQYQTFVAGTTGLLTKIKLQHHNYDNNVAFTLKIYCGAGTSGLKIAEECFSFSCVGNGQWLTCELPCDEQPLLICGQTYTFRIYGNAGTNFKAGGPNAYPCGYLWTALFGVSCNDITFKTYMTIPDWWPPCVITRNRTLALNANGQLCIDACDVNNGSYDNNGIAAMWVCPNEFDCCDVGPNVVTLYVMDNCGNIASNCATVNVCDNTAPTLTLKPGPYILNLDASGNATLCLNDVVQCAWDACGIEEVELSQTQFTCANLGYNLVEVECEDENENENEQCINVLVRDCIAPVLCLNSNVTVYLNSNGVGCLNVCDVDNGSTDNCCIVSRTLTRNGVTGTSVTFNCCQLGAQYVTFKAYDASGNCSTQGLWVNVVDCIAPEINVALNLPYNCYYGAYILWPPDGCLEDICASVYVCDNTTCTSFQLTSITTNQLECGLSPCDIPDDIQGECLYTPDTYFKLRAERFWGTRTYAITYTCTDAAGNTDCQTVYVKVPNYYWKDGEEPLADAEAPELGLMNIAPNPFTTTAQISYTIPQSGPVTIEIYNSLGEKVTTLVSEEMKEGAYNVAWDGLDSKGSIMANGVYICRINAGSYADTKNIVLNR